MNRYHAIFYFLFVFSWLKCIAMEEISPTHDYKNRGCSFQEKLTSFISDFKMPKISDDEIKTFTHDQIMELPEKKQVDYLARILLKLSKKTSYKVRRNSAYFTIRPIKGLFICSCCKIDHGNYKTMKQHLHQFSGTTQCTFCHLQFQFPSRFFDHLFFHARNSLISCNYCNKEFKTIQEIRKHKNKCLLKE